MLVCTLFAGLAPCPAPAIALFAIDAAPAAAAPELSLAPPEPAASAAPLAQGTRRRDETEVYLSLGYHYVDGDPTALPGSWGTDDGEALSIDVGYTAWTDEMGISIEAGLMQSSFDADVSSITTDSVDTLRVLLGLRVADRGAEGTSLVPYARAGFLYRRDSGDMIEDEGTGWYAGLGFDWMLTPRVGIGPQVLYTEAGSLDAREWVYGAALSFRF
jgi:hypothetical protein